MDDSPFSRKSRCARSPPTTPVPADVPVTVPPAIPVAAPTPQGPHQKNDGLEVITTSEIQNWMMTIEQSLKEVCAIAAEGKLNMDQKLRINALCRKVSNGTSQMAVHYQSIKAKAVQYHNTIHMLENQLDLSQQLQNLKKTIGESMKPALGSSFADMVRKGANNYIQPINLSSVAIYPNDKLKTSDETKSLVQTIIRPEQMKLHVRGLRKTKNGGVIISTESKDDIEKLRQSVQLTKSGLTVDEPHRRKPRVVIIGVPTSMQEKEVFTCLYHQNLTEKLQDCSLDMFLTSIKLSHKSGKKDAETCNYVVEVSAVIRKALMSNDRVFVNWSSCPVRDFTLVTRCYKCQQYGHAAKSCRQTSYTCGHCGDQGHSVKECPKKADEPKCATCLHFKKPDKHNTGAADCPAKIMAEKRYINSIDYGGA